MNPDQEDIEDAFQHALEESKHLSIVKKHLYQAGVVEKSLKRWLCMVKQYLAQEAQPQLARMVSCCGLKLYTISLFNSS